MNNETIKLIIKLRYDTLVRSTALAFAVVFYFMMAKRSFFYLPSLWFLFLGLILTVYISLNKEITDQRTKMFVLVEISILTNLMAFLPYLSVVFNEKRSLYDENLNLTREGLIGLILTLALPFLIWYLNVMLKKAKVKADE